MQNKIIVLVLRISAFTLLFGRGLQHIFWDTPYRALFWSETTLQSFIENWVHISWYEYVTGTGQESFIKFFVISVGLFYLFLAVACLTVNSKNKYLLNTIPIGSFLMGVLTLLYFKESSFQMAQLIEHASQILCPYLLYLSIKGDQKSKIVWFLRIAISLTFLGHGLYAIGYYPVPGNFIDMVIRIFGVLESEVLVFLQAAAILDFIVAIGVLIPKPPFWILLYAAFWGILTALARVVANVDASDFLHLLAQWAPHTIYRFPHGLLPLALLFYSSHSKSFKLSKNYSVVSQN